MRVRRGRQPSPDFSGGDPAPAGTPSRSPPGPSTTWRWRDRSDRHTPRPAGIPREPAGRGVRVPSGAVLPDPARSAQMVGGRDRRRYRGASMTDQLRTPQRPRPSRRRGVEGGRHRRPLPREGVPRGAGVLHRRRGGRHPEPGDGPARGARAGSHEVRHGGAGRAAEIIGYDEVVMLGYRDSGMPDTPENADPRQLRPAPTRRGRRPAGRDHPARAARRSSSPTATTRRATRTPTTSGCTTSPCRRSTRPAIPTPTPSRASRGSRSKLYYSVWSRARMLAMHEKFLRARARVAVRRAVVRAAVAGRPHHDPGRRRRATTSPASRRCWPTPPRSTRRRRSGSGCPTTWPRTVHPLRGLHPRPQSLVAHRDPRGRPVRRASAIASTLTGADDSLVPVTGRPSLRIRTRREAPWRRYLSQEWLDLQKELAQEFPERPGATARMQYVVTGAPEATSSTTPSSTTARWSRTPWARTPTPSSPDPDLRRLGEGPEGRARRQRRVHAGPR